MFISFKTYLKNKQTKNKLSAPISTAQGADLPQLWI